MEEVVERRFLGFLIKITMMALFNALAIFACTFFVISGDLYLSITGIVLLVVVNAVVFTKKSYPLRYLLPGLFFLTAMVVLPILYNVYLSFTNYSTGHVIAKDDAINLFLNREYLRPDAEKYSFKAYGNDSNIMLLLLKSDEELLVDMTGEIRDPGEFDIVYNDLDGTPDRIGQWNIMEGPKIATNVSLLQKLRIPYGNGWLRLSTLREFRQYEHQYAYDEATDTLTDLKTGKAYRSEKARFISSYGEALDPGWTEYVGLQNYLRIINTEKYRKPFFGVFIWTIEWSLLTVLISFVIGLFLAMMLNDSKLRFRKLYRSLLIVPYAMPSFISLLVWRYGFYSSEFGFFNRMLKNLAGISIPWLDSVFWARFSVLLTNIWLTFPYMMLVSLGALQAISPHLLEAAKIDGAGSWQKFRKVTFPLVIVTLAPLLIGSFATTFNNFTVIWLLTEGHPVMGIGDVAGATDILISYAYKLAFSGREGSEMALSAAVSVVIFAIVVTISIISFRRTRVLEDVANEI
jgi:maltose/maltodextrin transport system permease protein/arabinogalactan oligomer/maltooligosaccharide transport system permease protein